MLWSYSKTSKDWPRFNSLNNSSKTSLLTWFLYVTLHQLYYFVGFSSIPSYYTQWFVRIEVSIYCPSGVPKTQISLVYHTFSFTQTINASVPSFRRHLDIRFLLSFGIPVLHRVNWSVHIYFAQEQKPTKYQTLFPIRLLQAHIAFYIT